jgi:hypothetical protein
MTDVHVLLSLVAIFVRWMPKDQDRGSRRHDPHARRRPQIQVQLWFLQPRRLLANMFKRSIPAPRTRGYRDLISDPPL